VEGAGQRGEAEPVASGKNAVQDRQQPSHGPCLTCSSGDTNPLSSPRHGESFSYVVAWSNKEVERWKI
jgi:hypothetical protein